ncbi:MAG: hypothetical protein PF689_02955 [Deltaproteobacteria bacterium]|jgi:transcription elongation factor Elf1|nr:hypothetical protein [Deltaproteobacteria bacterium]
MNLVTIGLKFNTGCPECSGALNVTKIKPEIYCPACEHSSKISKELWFDLLSEQITKGIGLKNGETSGIKMMTGEFGSTIHFQITRTEFACPYCETNQQSQLFEAIKRGQNNFACNHCQQGLSWRQPPSWLPNINKNIKYFAGETEQTRKEVPEESVPFNCYHCGAALKIDKDQAQVECEYCQNTATVPPEIRTKLQGTKIVGNWFAVVDLGKAQGILPVNSFRMFDLGAASNGDFYVIYEDYGDGGYVLLRSNREGMVFWFNHQIHCVGDPVIHVYPESDNVLIIDADGKRFYLISGKDGSIIGRYQGNGILTEDSHSFGNSIFGSCDFDGTFILKKTDSQGHQYFLHRYDESFKEQPLWPGMKGNQSGNFFARILGKTPGPVKLAWDEQIAVGWDRKFYILNKDKMTQYDGQGKKLNSCKVELDDLEYLIGFGVDKQGIVYLGYRSQFKIEGRNLVQIARQLPGENFKIWAGPLSKENPIIIGNLLDKIVVSPDGSCLITGGDFEDIKMIDSQGNKVFFNESIRREDEKTCKKIKAAMDRSSKFD